MLTQHMQDVEKIRQQFLEERKSASSFTLQAKGKSSNTIRDNSYRKQGSRLNIDNLNRVLKIDVEQRVALVEPRVTMEELVKATLPYRLVPPVLPEFKGITVGGAIMGTALESSSHLYGQFNDCCLAYEVLLGDGTVVRASPDEHADLFYGISGSYGSLGIILSVELRLIPSTPSIYLSYSSFLTIEQAVAKMGALHRQKSPPDYLESLSFGHNETVVVSGKFIQENDIPAGTKRRSLSHFWSPWFCQHVKERGISGGEEIMPIQDYLFRHDRAAFWMGAYALHPSMLFRYLLDLGGICPAWYREWQSKRDGEAYGRLKYPSPLFRGLFGWQMNSQRLYALLHSGTEKWFADRFVIQDFYIPEGKTTAFTQHVLDEYRIIPLWLCPIKSTKTAQILSPHYQQNGGSDLFFDVGVYGFPQGHEASFATKDLEALAHSYGGRKMLYGYSYFSEKDFWKVYSEESYKTLRQKYHAQGTWKEITDKVLTG